MVGLCDIVSGSSPFFRPPFRIPLCKLPGGGRDRLDYDLYTHLPIYCLFLISLDSAFSSENSVYEFDTHIDVASLSVPNAALFAGLEERH